MVYPTRSLFLIAVFISNVVFVYHYVETQKSIIQPRPSQFGQGGHSRCISFEIVVGCSHSVPFPLQVGQMITSAFSILFPQYKLGQVSVPPLGSFRLRAGLMQSSLPSTDRSLIPEGLWLPPLESSYRHWFMAFSTSRFRPRLRIGSVGCYLLF